MGSRFAPMLLLLAPLSCGTAGASAGGADAATPDTAHQGVPDSADTSPASDLTPVFQPDARLSLYDTPWPSDHLRQEGKLDLSLFPRSAHPLVAKLLAEVTAQVDGYATMPVVYVAFSTNPGDVALPMPAETLSPTSTVQLLALGGDCGARVPVESVFRSHDDEFLPPHALSVSPVPGFVLAPSAKYALVVLRSFGAADGRPRTAQPAAFADALVHAPEGSAYGKSLESLRACLGAAQLAPEDIAVATVFTTQDPLRELRSLVDSVRSQTETPAPSIPDVGPESTKTYTNVPGKYRSYSGHYETPIYQAGQSPYTEAGGFRYDAAGRPIIARWERVPFIVTLPDDGKPHHVFLWQSGAKASLTGHVNQAFTQTLLDAGIAVAKFLPQFHGDRNVPGGDPDLHTYNYLNPESARAVLRQQALDAAYFVRVVREALPGYSETSRMLSPRIVMGGHSQGAEVSAMLAAASPDVSAYVLSGVGTYLSETIVHRTNPFDVPKLLASLLGITGPIDRFHPAIALVQMAGEVVDPGNHLASFRGWAGRREGAHVLVLDGKNDLDVYYTSMHALVIGLDAAPIAPAGWDVDPFGVWSRAAEPLPLSGNRRSLAGTELTMAAWLDANDDHYVLWNSARARELARDFIVSAMSTTPTLR